MNTVFLHSVDHTALMNRLPALLRILGAATLVVAMYSFLVRGWQSGNDVSRYLMMLAHTGVLAAVGLASGHWLKEGKGARLLLSLALISVPANFAILGAFIFSQTAKPDIAGYPHYVAWTVESLPVALTTTAAALLVLVPVTFFGFSVLARNISRKLALLFLAGNLALLLPLRDPHGIALLVAALGAGVAWYSRRTARGQTVARTREGTLALGLQLLPLGVLLGRSLWLYAFDQFLATLLAATLFVVLRQCSLYLQQGSLLRNALDAISVVPALTMAPLFGEALDTMDLLPDAWPLPVGTLVTAALVYDISQRSQTRTRLYRRLAVLFLLSGAIGNLLLFANPTAALVCIIEGVLVMALGYRKRQFSLFAGGTMLVLTGVVQQVIHLVQHFDLTGWLSLAVLGTVSIVFASLLETQGGRVWAHFKTWRERVQAWEA